MESGELFGKRPAPRQRPFDHPQMLRHRRLALVPCLFSLDHSFRVNVDHDALAAEAEGGFADEIGILHRRRVDGHLIAAGFEQRADVFQRADAAAHGQRHEDDFTGPADDVQMISRSSWLAVMSKNTNSSAPSSS